MSGPLVKGHNKYDQTEDYRRNGQVLSQFREKQDWTQMQMTEAGAVQKFILNDGLQWSRQADARNRKNDHEARQERNNKAHGNKAQSNTDKLTKEQDRYGV